MAYATLLHPVKALISVFPMVMYPRLTSLIFSFVSVTKSCLRYWHTQLPCTQGSKLCVPNGFAPKISIIAGIPSGCVHKIHSTASVPSSCDIGLVYPCSGCAHKIYIAASVPNNSKFFTACPISQFLICPFSHCQKHPEHDKCTISPQR